ncbi:MAG: type I-E CRISPR-associated protein Cas6/Cse3/CasE [Rubellimicrobium sp.]|nr:type I-E CRISPR-associated protein Cas6/Cse3/CasE [Rubellimicrobium sp.]
MTLYLSRLRLARDPATRALDGLLNPGAAGARKDAHHRLIWSCFANDPEQRRDFLWRTEGRGLFLTLSQRPPERSPLFDPPEVKEFAPDLKPGDRLGFALRANATRTEKTGGLSSGGRERKRHIDLVMDALKPVPKGERAEVRMKLAQGVAESWLAAQGSRHGFDPEAITLADYGVSVLPGYRGRRQGQPQYGIMDLAGTLVVTDPVAFLAALGHGFGRAKAFGCGLMLIRRTG